MSESMSQAFQQRRQLDLALSKLAVTQSEQQLLSAAQAIAQAYPSKLILPALVKNLNTPNSQLRGGLGHLAALLPVDEAAPALRVVAADRRKDAQERITAALILERFVGEPVPAALISDLSQSNEVAFQSLREAVEDARQNRHILLEYATQMRQAGGDIAYMVMELIDRLPAGDRVEMLRLIALDDRLPVASAALSRLEQLARGEAGPQALAALHTLHFVLPPELAASTERTLRKLRFAGLRYQPPSPEGWRALMTPANMGGYHTIWFVRMPSAGGGGLHADGARLALILSGHAGLAHAAGAEGLSGQRLPAPRAVGELVTVQMGEGQAATMLEIPFDFARWLVFEALGAHWQTASELPAEFKLYCSWIGQFAAPQVTPDLQACFADAPDTAWALFVPELEEATSALLAHPVMALWLHGQALLTPAQIRQVKGRRRPVAEARAAQIRAVLAELDEQPEGALLRQSMAQGLSVQAAWLLLAGSPEQSERARLLAHATRELPLSQNPLPARVIEAGLAASARP